MLEKSINKFNKIPALGLGCMRLPRLYSNKDDINEAEALEMFDYAYKQGIRYFDTAFPYHNQMSEEFVGRALKKYPRESFYLATKMPIWVCKTKEDVKRVFNTQLKTLQVEYFDFYLCHAMNYGRHERYIELDAYNFLLEMKKEGKIRNLGFSFHDVAKNLEILADYLPWDFAQIQLNYLDWQLQDAKLQYEILEERKIACIVMEPVRGGALANVCLKATTLFKAMRPKSSIASWALRYAASMPNVLVVLSGMSNMSQLIDNVGTFTNFEYLTKNEQEIIQKAKQVILGNKFIPCTGCRYCMPCSVGVDIPKIFSLYNQFQIDKNKSSFLEKYNHLSDKEVASKCVSCKKCLSECPQHINICDNLNNINNEVLKLR